MLRARFNHTTAALAATSTLALALSACSAVGADDDAPAGEKKSEVVLLTHDSFALPDEVKEAFTDETGYDLVTRASGDGGELTNKLVLSEGNPQGDAAFGVDNTFGSRAVSEGVFSAFDGDLPDGVAEFALPGDDDSTLVPVDTGNVCVNVDKTYFADNDLEAPETLADLTKPAYRGLFVTPGAATSSPGLAFLLATVAEFGDDWPQYWEDLVANDTLITAGWSDAYQVEFTQGGGKGNRPIVLSYDSSPAFTVTDDGETTTEALLDTCLRQIEYVGVLAGAVNPEGAQALIEFMLTDQVQSALPESMFVFPVVPDTELPSDWATYAEQPTEPITIDPELVDTERDEWLSTWSDVTSS